MGSPRKVCCTAQPAGGSVMLEILDNAGKTMRRYASTDPVQRVDASNAPVPLYWYRPPQILSPQRRPASCAAFLR